MNKIQDKFSVFWYNDAEINHWNDADFEAKAASFADAGVNIVMTFSCTHFRWSYYPYRATINAALQRLVNACHKYNIRVVEHHSSHLTFAPLHQRHWNALKDKMVVRKGSIDMFPDLRMHLAMGDPEIAPGVYLSDCRQIDGRTGRAAYTPYNGYAHCFNNPHFRQAYFDTLKDIYALNVDGIMTDDVQFFGEGNACTCKYCREKFKNETGYDLPQPAEWGKFYGDYQNKAFVEFLRFRVRSTENFQRAVNEHFTGLGLKLLRPNYTTSTFNRNISGYPFEAAGDLWSHVFQENMFSTIIQTAWLPWSEDAVHRSAMARKYSIDPMSMFYPSSYDNYYFCWALSRSWEHLLMATPEGGDLNDVELKFAGYEKTHPRLAGAADCMAEAAFLEPRSSLDYAHDPVESAMRPFHVWMQSVILTNRRVSLLFENDTLAEWLKYPAVIIAGATMLSDELLEIMQQYCQQGGKLFIFGKFGIYYQDGTRREHPEKIFGFTCDMQEMVPCGSGELVFNGQKAALEPVKENCIISNLAGDYTVTAQDTEGQICAISAMSGNLLYMPGGVIARYPAAMQYGISVSRWGSDPNKAVPAPDCAVDYLKRVPGKVLELFLNSTPQIKVDMPDCMASCFRDRAGNKFYLHLVNTAGVLQKPPAMVSHAFKFVNFAENAPACNRAFTVEFKLPANNFVFSQVTACSPEFTGEKVLEYQQQKDVLVISVPARLFAGYLNIIIQ